MAAQILLGIDMGGTHTDAALIECNSTGSHLIAKAKVPTNHDNLPDSLLKVLKNLADNLADPKKWAEISNVTLGTTLAVNAVVQCKTDPVGLVLSAGPGLSPLRFAMGNAVTVVPGGLDHRGVEVTRLELKKLGATLVSWKNAGIHNLACVGKFSPRNPDHENAISTFCAEQGFMVTSGHRLSGSLNYPRRIATSFYNAAVRRIQNEFLDAVESALKTMKIHAHVRLLKADGGAINLELARTEPVQSILSGPAASVMGVLALAKDALHGVSLLLDVGGTTCDIAVILDGSPIVDRDGMLLQERRTLVRSLATTSIGVGGDARITITQEQKGLSVHTGPIRAGFAMAFGGSEPTFLDALNAWDRLCGKSISDRGDSEKSLAGIKSLAADHGLEPKKLAELAITDALQKINLAAYKLLAQINAKPIYTLAKLRAQTNITLDRVLLVGGPAEALKSHLEEKLQLPVVIPANSEVANAIGACLTKPTVSLEFYADTGSKRLRCPKIDHTESISRSTTLSEVKDRACQIMQEYLTRQNIHDAEVEVVESDLFATLDDYGSSSKDMRVSCQAVPGIVERLA